MADKLKYDEMPVSIDKLPFDPNRDITPEDLELIFSCLSEKQQDNFLNNLKDVLPKKEWETLVIHLKSYDLAMMGEHRMKASLMKNTMGIALYNYFNEN